MIATHPSSSPRDHDPWNALPVTISHFRRHSSGVFTVDLAFYDSDAARGFAYAPGQFNMLYVPGIGEAALSIAGTTATGLIQHTIRSVGSVTKAIEMGGVGMSLGVRGPFGSGWPLSLKFESRAETQSMKNSDRTNRGDVIIVAGGIGLAPLRSMVNHIAGHRNEYGKVSIVIGARAPIDLLYQDEYDDWRKSEMTVHCTVDRAPSDWKGQIGVVTLLLERLEIPNSLQTTVMTCGPEVMMRYAARSALGRGIPEQQIFVTLERNMNCAIGLCGHCQLGPAFICKDGPVFPYHLVKSLLRVQDL